MKPLAITGWLKIVVGLPFAIVAAWIHDPILIATWVIVMLLGVLQILRSKES